MIPDFEQIARQLFAGWVEEFEHNSMASGNLEQDITRVVEQLRQVWNARGAADLEEVAMSHLCSFSILKDGHDAKVLEDAIRTLDR